MDEWTLLDEFRHLCGEGELDCVKLIANMIENRQFPPDFESERLPDGSYPYTVAQLRTHTDDQGSTALHFAAANNQLETVQWLVEILGVPFLPNHQGNTPLHWAVGSGAFETVKYFCDRVAQVNVMEKNKFGKSPIHIACEIGHGQILGELELHTTNIIDEKQYCDKEEETDDDLDVQPTVEEPPTELEEEMTTSEKITSEKTTGEKPTCGSIVEECVVEESDTIHQMVEDSATMVD